MTCKKCNDTGEILEHCCNGQDCACKGMPIAKEDCDCMSLQSKVRWFFRTLFGYIALHCNLEYETKFTHRPFRTPIVTQTKTKLGGLEMDYMVIMEKGLRNLKDITKIQCSKGNYDQSEYMRGMANGMILAVATMENKDPEYFEAPKKIGE